MAHVDWHIKGIEIATCNCDWGCPCQFNAMPTHGDCRAAVAMQIDKGHFGDVRLDGLRWLGMFAWPGAIHEGNGEGQVVIDVNANEAQRSALLKILSGEETEPGATIFSVLSMVVETVHDPLFRTIEFSADMGNRTGHFAVEGLVDAKAAPITNPVTGEPHRARVVLPNGFEYHEAEYASSWVQGREPVPLSWLNGHSHFAKLDLGPNGPAH